jgi:HAD superfamily hydrolase (TIGR01509 family)
MNIKLIIFDLDGVLIDAKEIHYESLNKAIRKIAGDRFTINREEHIGRYDGLNTKAKLKLLTLNKGLAPDKYEGIFNLKQQYTQELIEKNISFNEQLYNDLGKLKKNFKLCVASNSICDTVTSALFYTKLSHHISFFYSNEDVKNPKPHPEIYLQCMLRAGVSPKETLIIEDSYNGRLGAEQTGAYVYGVNSPADVTYSNIMNSIESQGQYKMKWKSDKLNVLIPMAGLGSRFEKAGYTFPKPLIEVKGKPMIQVVAENLNIDAQFIYIVQRAHYDKYNLKSLLNLITPNCKIVIIDGLTDGAARTALTAEQFIDNDTPLLIANSDQFLEWDSSEFMYAMMGDFVDGGIVTFTATHPKWSFAKIDKDGFITEVAEKNPISDIATVGVYFWKKGKDFVDCAKLMIRENIRTNGEFYICPTFNEGIKSGMKIKRFHINKMYGLGTPEDLNYFVENYKGTV